MNDVQVVRKAFATVDKALRRHVADLEPEEVEAWSLLRHFIREMVTPTFTLTTDDEADLMAWLDRQREERKNG